MLEKFILNANEMVIFWRILKSFGSQVANFKNYHRPNFQPPTMFVVGIVCQNVRFFAKFWPFSEPNFEFCGSHKKFFMGANNHYFIHILRLFHFWPGQINFILVYFPLKRVVEMTNRGSNTTTRSHMLNQEHLTYQKGGN